MKHSALKYLQKVAIFDLCADANSVYENLKLDYSNWSKFFELTDADLAAMTEAMLELQHATVAQGEIVFSD